VWVSGLLLLLLSLLLLLLLLQRSNMRVLLYDSALVVSFLQLLTKLVDQSDRWSLGRRGPPPRAAATAEHSAVAAAASVAAEPAAGTGLGQPGDSGSSSSSSSTGLERQTLREPCWQIYYARNASGRLPLRLEYLLATGRQEEVGVIVLSRYSIQILSYPLHILLLENGVSNQSTGND
jgi:hypothetical protein